MRIWEVTLAEAQQRLPDLVQAARTGERVVITDGGSPVAEISSRRDVPPGKRVEYGFMRGEILCKPGWDDPIDVDDFLAGNF